MPGQSNVIAEPIGVNGSIPQSYIISLATLADEIPAWGTAPLTRDLELRKFWPTEPILSSAIFSTASRYASLEWNIGGQPKTVAECMNWIKNVELGEGWTALWMKTLVDLFTTDNGAFIEIVRTADSPTAPCISLNHLDSCKCVRTGNHLKPVVYYDMYGKGHEMAWYQIAALAEMPSPVQEMRGMQMCAVSRMLRAAQILRDISIYKKEKVSGRFNRAVHLVGGIQTRIIEEAMKNHSANADAAGLARYIQPVIIGSLDPTATVSVETLQLASLPDNFDEESNARWYINQLSLAFGSDYQDFAPLPAGNLGTSQQSKTLDRKGRGKGVRLFMTMVETLMNNRGILPSTVVFDYDDRDLSQEEILANLQDKRAITRKIRIDSAEITPQVARQIAVELGDLDEEYLAELEQADKDAELKAQQQLQQQQEHDIALKKAAPGNQQSEHSSKVDTQQINSNKDFIQNVRDTVVGAVKAINIPAVPAPVVNVTLPESTVNVPAPMVTVNVPQQPAPIVNMAAPIVNLPETKGVVKTVTRNKDGQITSVTEKAL